MQTRFLGCACAGLCLVLARPALGQQVSPPADSPSGVLLGQASSAAPTSAPVVAPASKSTLLDSLFRDVTSDASRLFSPRNGIWIGLGGAISLTGRIHERDLTRRLASSPALDRFFDPGEIVGGAMFQLGAAITTYAAGRALDSSVTADVGYDLIRAQILTQSITQAVKWGVNRTRPDQTQFSFPSGHAATTFATATVLQRHFGWKAGVPAYALATYVAGSRLQENRHFASDVIFGATLGILAARAVTVEVGGARFGLSPVSSPHGGVGMGLTLVSR